MKIGVYSGSFNPIHIGHTILGSYLIDFTDIDEVWYLISPLNPFKQEDKSLLDESLRLEMARLGLSKYPKLVASDYEFFLPRPSYTHFTLKSLKESYPEHEFTLVIGSDNWQEFHRWKDYQCILKNFSIMIFKRLGYSGTEIEKTLQENVRLLDAPIIEISSTNIRNIILDKKDFRPYLSSEVYDFIIENQLYKI